MTKLPDEKLIDKIMEDIDEDDGMLVDIRGEQLTKDTLKNILQKHLTHPTDEVREEHPCYKCGNLCNDFCGKCGQDQEVILEKEVEGIEKEEPTPIKNILSKLVKERDATNNGEYNYDQTEIGYANGLARAIQIIEQEPIGHKELVSVTCPKCGLLIKNPLYKDNMPKEVKPPTKDTIEKIGDFKDLYSFPNNPRVGQTCAGYIWNGEHRLEQGFDYMKFECLRTKYNELVDTVNHQQEQIKQLLSDK